MQSTVLVVGAGPAGLCLALALARHGLFVRILERQPEAALSQPTPDGREVALTHGAMRFLRDIGVWAQLPAEAIVPLRQARILDGDHPGFAVDAQPFGQDRLGTFVANHHIRTAAWRAASAHPLVQLHAGTTVQSVCTDAAAAHVHLQDGRRLDATLLVAADSRFSHTRRAMGIPTYMHDFGRSMLLCRVQHDVAGDGTAWQWFGQRQTRAVLPISEHLSSVVLTVTGNEAQRLLALSGAAFADELARRLQYRLGTLQLQGQRHCYPMVGSWARRFVDTRFALVGDAAVGLHPVTAHGFNTGLASAERLAWAAALGQRRWRDAGHPRALARYQRQHRLGSALLFGGTQAVARLFENDQAWARPLRHGILDAGRRLPLLPRALAVGLLDATPRPIGLLGQLRRAASVLRPPRATPRPGPASHR